MKTRTRALLAALVALVATSTSAQLPDFLKGLPQLPSSGGGLGDARIAQGLKEALKVGTENAVGVTGRVDGYFANQASRMAYGRYRERAQSMQHFVSRHRSAGKRAVGKKHVELS